MGIALLIFAALAGPDPAAPAEAQAEAEEAFHGAAEPAPNMAADGLRTGRVLEALSAGGYTYVHLDTADGEVWVAGPPVEVEVGATVLASKGALMRNFTSLSLERTFEYIHFVGYLAVQDEQMPKRAPPEVERADGAAVAKVAGELTVHGLMTSAGDFVGKKVSIRGQVVRFTPSVQARNWIHLQDGTGEAAAKTHDLTVTTQEVVEVGQEVTLTGVVATNRDFGAGYVYDVLLEEATLVAK